MEEKPQTVGKQGHFKGSQAAVLLRGADNPMVPAARDLRNGWADRRRPDFLPCP